MIKFKLLALLSLFVALANIALAQYAPLAKGELVEHKRYSLDYCEEHEQAAWVYYTLTPQHLTGEVSRTDDFRPDPKVSTGSATINDYKSSGYDRGHLLPAADCSHSPEAMSQSFYMSNVSPQKAGLNRVGWLALEKLVRQWAYTHQELHIVTAGVLNSSLPQTIGANNVSVPKYFYKVIYAPKNNQMIAFIMPNDKLSNPLRDYATTVDEVERITGIDMFPQLNDTLENRLEGAFDFDCW